MAAIGHGMDRMLQHARRIAHPFDRAEIGGQRIDRRGARRDDPLWTHRARGGQLRHRILGIAAPDHRAAMVIGARCHVATPRVIVQQRIDRRGKSLTVIEIDQHAAPVGQDFGRMDIAGGHHWLAHADGIGQRARRDLRGVAIGGRVDVRRLQAIEQFVLFGEPVDKGDVAFDAQVARQGVKPVAIGFALMRDQVGMARAQHDIERVGVPRRDRGHRPDHRFDPLAGRQQAKGQDQPAILPPETWLQRRAVDQRAVGHAMRDHRHPARVDAVDAGQDFAPAMRHHDDARASPQQRVHHPPLVRAGRFQDRVERGDDRQRRAVEQCDQMFARRAAIDAIFMLDPDRLRTRRLDRAGGIEIGTAVMLGNGSRHLRRIGIAPGMVVHRINVDPGVGIARMERVERIGGEGCKATFARQEVADQREVIDRNDPVRDMRHPLLLRSSNMNQGGNARLDSLNAGGSIWLQSCCIATRGFVVVSQRLGGQPRPR